MSEKYQLRHAAGLYWLIDMEQRGADFQSPVCFNESGAYLWDLVKKGLSGEQIAERLAEEYALEKEEARKDVELFLGQLAQNHIRLQ